MPFLCIVRFYFQYFKGGEDHYSRLRTNEGRQEINPLKYLAFDELLWRNESKGVTYTGKREDYLRPSIWLCNGVALTPLQSMCGSQFPIREGFLFGTSSAWAISVSNKLK